MTHIDFKPSTADEINSYYKTKFAKHSHDMPGYISMSPEYAFAFQYAIEVIAHGKTESRDFVRRNNRGLFSDLDNICLDFKKWDPLKQARTNQPVTGLYFGVNNIKDFGWLLWFDIDAKDIAEKGLCSKHSGLKKDATAEEEKVWKAMLSAILPLGYLYCYECVKLSVGYAFSLKDILSGYGFASEDIHIYYSGQGAHIHVIDKHAWTLPRHSREFLIKMISEKESIPIDPVVTADERRVCRIPYSLNGKVSRVVIPLSSRNQDYMNESIPCTACS